LARELQERAIGIVLSGTGHDGAQGVHAIKDGAGMVIAQSPESAEFDGMPLSAIATGLVSRQHRCRCIARKTRTVFFG